MPTLPLTQFTLDQLARVARLEAGPSHGALWDAFEEGPLDDDDLRHIAWIVGHLRGFRTAAVNESTLWARAIYPLLMLAERDDVRAWSQVGVRAQVAGVDGGLEIAGVIDGVLAREHPIGAEPSHPFLLVLEAKRGVDASDPRPQLLGAMFASLIARGGVTAGAEQFGAYVVGDSWTFGRAELIAIEDAPGRSLVIDWSRELAERTEAGSILRIARAVVARGLASG